MPSAPNKISFCNIRVSDPSGVRSLVVKALINDGLYLTDKKSAYTSDLLLKIGFGLNFFYLSDFDNL